METGASLISFLISLVLTAWFVIFSVLVVQKLNKVIELLGKK
jgi:cell division protein FtsB